MEELFFYLEGLNMLAHKSKSLPLRQRERSKNKEKQLHPNASTNQSSQFKLFETQGDARKKNNGSSYPILNSRFSLGARRFENLYNAIEFYNKALKCCGVQDQISRNRVTLKLALVHYQFASLYEKGSNTAYPFLITAAQYLENHGISNLTTEYRLILHNILYDLTTYHESRINLPEKQEDILPASLDEYRGINEPPEHRAFLPIAYDPYDFSDVFAEDNSTYDNLYNTYSQPISINEHAVMQYKLEALHDNLMQSIKGKQLIASSSLERSLVNKVNEECAKTNPTSKEDSTTSGSDATKTKKRTRDSDIHDEPTSAEKKQPRRKKPMLGSSQYILLNHQQKKPGTMTAAVHTPGSKNTILRELNR